MATVEQLEAIAKQTVLHAEYMTDIARTFDYHSVKLFNDSTGKLVSPSDKMRRLNDFLAAAYTHSIARYADSGDDCIDKYGHAIELKLAFVKARDLKIGVSGSSIVTQANNSFLNSVNAKFRVYNGTDKNHHNKDTAFILMSQDHNCFITGFMMTGDLVTKYVHSDTRTSSMVTKSIVWFRILVGLNTIRHWNSLSWQRNNGSLARKQMMLLPNGSVLLTQTI
jgi:hypothetical protein